MKRSPLWRRLRPLGVALLTPVLFSLRTGHWRSALQRRALGPDRQPLPWYTYPAIDFLAARDCRDARILEFGAGQSTLWWGARARQVLAFEGNAGWAQSLRSQLPANCEVVQVPFHARRQPECIAPVRAELARRGNEPFDLVVIDGLYRRGLVDVALERVTETGAILVDNAGDDAMDHAFRGRGMMRVDFYGYAPGTPSPHCTALFFRPGSRWLAEDVPIRGRSAAA